MKQNLTTVYVVVMVVLLFTIVGGAVYAFTRSDSTNNENRSNVLGYNNAKLDSTENNNQKTMNTDAPKSTPTPLTELIKEDVVIGTGAEAKAGDRITVHYTGKLMDGTVFDSSVSRGQPFQFVLGAGMVIQGWDQGFDGMKVGGKRILHIPSAMAYGSRGAGGIIKPNADLIFEVELLDVD